MPKTKSLFVALGPVAALALLALAYPHNSVANPGLAAATTTDPNNPTPCTSCHYAGREPEGRDSLNPTGKQYFFNCRISSVHDCHTLPQTASSSMSPSPAPAPAPLVAPAPAPAPFFAPAPAPQPSFQPSQPNNQPLQMATALFKDDCQNSDSYFAVRPAGGGHLINFQLKNFHAVRLRLPIGSTYAHTCDRWPTLSEIVHPVVFE